MPNRNLEKGKRWELEVRDYLRAYGLQAWRTALVGQHATHDRGDILVGDPATAIVQAKSTQSRRIRQDVAALRWQMHNAGMPHGWVCYKEARKPTSDGIVVLPLDVFASIYAAAHAYLTQYPVKEQHG